MVEYLQQFSVPVYDQTYANNHDQDMAAAPMSSLLLFAARAAAVLVIRSLLLRKIVD